MAAVTVVPQMPEAETRRLPPSLLAVSAVHADDFAASGGGRGDGGGAREDASSATVSVVSRSGVALVEATEVAAVAKVSGLPDEETLRPPPSLPSVSADAQP